MVTAKLDRWGVDTSEQGIKGLNAHGEPALHDGLEGMENASENRLSSLSIVFPAYNEEANVEAAVTAARIAMRKYFKAVEIIVVNDGSADRTGEIMDRLAEENRDVIPVHHPMNRGYGAALRSGFAKASGDYVFFTDSDLQFNLDDIALLVPLINQCDLATGYRLHRADSWNRKLNAWAWNRLVRLLLGVKVKDIDCAFKLFRRQVIDTVHLTANGAMINTELFGRIQKHGFSVKEVPVPHYKRQHGQQTGANLKVVLLAFRELFRLYRQLRVTPVARVDSGSNALTAARPADAVGDPAEGVLAGQQARSA